MKHRLMMVVGAGAMFGVLLLPASGQGALPGGESCVLSGSATISPGLKSTPQNGTVTFSGSLGLCHGSMLGIKNGTVSGSATGLGSCAASNDTLNATINWSNGMTSTISGAHLVSVGPLANVAGTITGGAFAGSPVGAEAVFQPVGLLGATQCAKAGVTNVTFKGATW